MIYATDEDVNRCLSIVKEELDKQGLKLESSKILEVTKDIMNISYSKGGDYSEKTISSFAETYIEEELYKFLK